MKNTYKNLDDIKRMQEEAFKRVQEMQKRAKRSLEYSQPYTLKNSSQNSVDNNTIEKEVSEEANAIKKESISESTIKADSLPKNKQSNILTLLTGDNERNLIVLLLMLLVDEETDISLVLALIYLIM